MKPSISSWWNIINYSIDITGTAKAGHGVVKVTSYVQVTETAVFTDDEYVAQNS